MSVSMLERGVGKSMSGLNLYAISNEQSERHFKMCQFAFDSAASMHELKCTGLVTIIL